MKKQTYQEVNSPTNWWLDIQNQTYQEEVFPEPVCQKAEAFFLSFILFLAIKHSAKENKKRIAPVTLVSYDNQRTTTATALQKMPLEYGGLLQALLNKQRRYSFGEHTNLILTGPLAGTIAQAVPYILLGFIKNKNFSGGPPLHTIRPFLPHTEISNKVTRVLNERTIYHNNLNKSAAHLDKVRAKFNPDNPVETLVDWLSLAGIPHDREIILANSQLGYTLLQQLAKK